MSDEIQLNSKAAIEKTAINMLVQKLDDALIRQVTGLSADELAKLKNRM
jgi:helix-turn-helix protein